MLFGKDVISGLSRHMQIEQDNIDAIRPMLNHDVKGIATIIRFEDVVLGGKDSAHLHTIDYRIVSNEDSLIVHGHSIPTRTARAMVS